MWYMFSLAPVDIKYSADEYVLYRGLAQMEKNRSLIGTCTGAVSHHVSVVLSDVEQKVESGGKLGYLGLKPKKEASATFEYNPSDGTWIQIESKSVGGLSAAFAVTTENTSIPSTRPSV